MWRLDGIDRFPRLLNLNVGGSFRRLDPLTSLLQLTHLHLTNNGVLDLAPLCRLPALRLLHLSSVEPQTLFALADAPRLHEIVADRCDANKHEAATLQEVLSSWKDEFCLAAPRLLAPLRFALEADDSQNRRRERVEADPWAGNTGMRDSETRWLARCLQLELDKTFGGPSWGSAGFPFLAIHSMEAAERFPEIVEAVRRVLASHRHAKEVFLSVALQDELCGQADDWKDPEEEGWKKERAEWEDFRRQAQEEAELRERTHRLRQLREEGVKIDPTEFEPPPHPAEPEADADDADFDSDEGETHPLGNEYQTYCSVDEQGVYVYENWRAPTERLMRRKVDRR